MKIGGTWDGQGRLGAQVVSTEEWLNFLTDEWGIPGAVLSDQAAAVNSNEAHELWSM
jgi:hypothetical protein